MSGVKRFWIAALLLAAIPTLSQAQTRRVAGTVTLTGSTEPVPGATIQVVGTTYGTTTDESGHFSVSVPSGNQQLRIRRIGYQARVVPVGSGDNSLTVGLARDVLQLETQVVTGQATSVSSANAANAVTVVSSQKLNQVPAATVDLALQGKVPGAVITQNSGAPGGGVSVQIRGVNTVLGSAQPLYVVDGVIVNNTAVTNGINVLTKAATATPNASSTQDQPVNRVADLNPNDIESIEVLKGPSASSIYGSKGTNGVILITTKQGAAGKTNVDFVQRVGNYQLSNELPLRCFTSGADLVAAGFDSTGYGAATNKCHDYQQEFFGASHPASYQTVGSVRGGTQAGTTFFGSATAQHDNGLATNDQYTKQSLRINLGQQLGKRLNVKAQSEVFHTLTQRGLSGNDNTGISPVFNFAVTPSFYDLQRQANGTYLPNGSSLTGGVNPFQDAAYIKAPENVYRLIASTSALLNVFSTQRQSLDLTLTGGIDSYSDHDKVLSPSNTYYEQNANSTGLPGTVYTQDATSANANLNLSAAHHFNASLFSATTSVGLRQERRQIDIVSITGRGLPFTSVQNVTQAAQTFPGEGYALNKDFSYFAQEEFLTMGEKLLLTAGVDAERSSVNGDEKKFFAYPKFSASYRLPWLPPATDAIKLRAAVGRAGNLPASSLTTGGPAFTYLTALLDEGLQGARASTVKGASAIQPEQATETEGGIDFTFLGGRVNLSATQFRKQIDNLLLQAALAPSTGFSSQFINGGQIVGHGSEFELDATPIQTSNFRWVSTTTYASVKQRITQLPVPSFSPGGGFAVSYGQPIIQLGASPSAIQSYIGCKALSSTGTCSTANKIVGIAGNATPDYTMGFSNNLTFGPLSFSSLLDWRKGGKVVDLTQNNLDSFHIDEDVAGAAARLAAFNAGQPVYVENGGFVKLREITVAYALPKGFTNTLFASRAQDVRLELSGRNLKTWTKYRGLDPEVSNFGTTAFGGGQDVTPYPPSRSFFVSLLATF